MDPLQVLSTFGPLVMSAAAAGVGIGIWRALGRVEGTIEPWGDRLERHSEEIDRHAVALIRLEDLPLRIEDLRRVSSAEHAALREKIEELSRQWRDDCRECLLRRGGEK